MSTLRDSHTADTRPLSLQAHDQGYDVRAVTEPSYPAGAVGAYRDGELHAVFLGEEAVLPDSEDAARQD